MDEEGHDNCVILPHIEPREVFYCKICSMPPEYCFYGNKFLQCLSWLKENNVSLYDKLYGDNEMLESLKKLHLKDESSAKVTEDMKEKKVHFKDNDTCNRKKVTISKEQRNKKKSITIINGMKDFNIDLKKASKLFSTRFSCGSSVTALNDIIVQGDVVDAISDVIISNWPDKIKPTDVEIK